MARSRLAQSGGVAGLNTTALVHEGSVRMADHEGLQDGQAYLVLEHVDGQGLAAHVRQRCPLVAQRVQMMMRIAETVDHAHAQLIVHRDLKPSNVDANRHFAAGRVWARLLESEPGRRKVSG